MYILKTNAKIDTEQIILRDELEVIFHLFSYCKDIRKNYQCIRINFPYIRKNFPYIRNNFASSNIVSI
jgi:hypothetical protein